MICKQRKFNMAKQFCFVFFLLAFFPSPSYGLSLLTETVKCQEYCERTYPLHTYPTVKHLQACQHGCYTAAKQKSFSSLGFRFVHNCSQECEDKFSMGSDYACKLGCAKGKNINHETRTPTTAKRSTPENREHSTIGAMILRPVFLLHTYGRGMINRLTYYIQSSTSFYFRSDDGGMVVVNIQSQPQVYVSSSNYYDQHPALSNDEQDEKQKEQKDKTAGGYSEQHESWIVVRRGHHWLHCVSHKSGVPLWILSSILFLSSFFLLWLCCAATVTSPSAKKSQPEKKAFLIKEFLSASKKKDGQDVPLLSLDENERQADPLPRKDKSAAVISI